MSTLVSIGIISCGIVIILMILRAIARKQITETHGLFWLMCAVLIVIGGASPSAVFWVADLFGVEYAPAVIFTAAIIMLFFLMFRCTKWISSLTMRVQELGMQVSMLNQENLSLMAKVEALEAEKKSAP